MADAAAGKNVLVVDDSYLVRRLHKTNLELMGFSVTEAVNGQEGLDKLAQEGPDKYCLVITDLLMPVLNGIEFISKSVKTHGEKLPPVVVCSSKSDIDLVRKLITAGIKGYILKPVDPQAFTKKIKEILPGT
jgi:two-component system chemotaxis response regulator CheY